MLRDKRTGSTSRIDRLFESTGVVVVGLGSIGRREKSRAKSVLFNKTLRQDEEELGPDLANGVDTPVTFDRYELST